jgi:hypothetical protein
VADVELFGEVFALNPREDYEWAMIEFADAAMGGTDADLLSGAAAVMALLREAIAADQWERFRKTARAKKAQTKRDLMPIVVQIFTQAAERPTGLPSDSSAGQRSTPESSEVASYRRVIEREEASGRPDRALMVQMAQESATS